MYCCPSLSEEQLPTKIAVKVEAGCVHRDEGWQGSVAPVTEGEFSVCWINSFQGKISWKTYKHIFKVKKECPI